MCMSVLFEEQDNLVIERSAENVIPVSVFEEMVLHHESFELNKMKEIVEKVGGKVFSEGYHV